MLELLLNSEIGACAYGSTRIELVPEVIMKAYSDWLTMGYAAGMDYMHNHLPIRRDPRLLLPEAQSIISLAFPYSPAEWRPQSLPVIASYAYGIDYHDVIRKRLREAVSALEGIFGGEYRICIDSAPIFERFWAERCGIGKRSDNGLIAVAGFGTRVFLAEILSTVELPIENGSLLDKKVDGTAIKTSKIGGWEEDSNKNREEVAIGEADTLDSCIHCGKCQRACPAGALQQDSEVDARKCLSYLTIEHRGDWTAEGKSAMRTPAGRHTLFGCDICQQVCPMNAPLNPSIPSTQIEEFSPRPHILTLTAAEAKEMTQEEFSRIFKGSAIKRTKLAGFLRNANNLL